MEEALQNPAVKNDAEAILTKRNLFCFPIGTFGRDMACSGLIAQLLNYIYFTKTVDAAMLSVITILMTVIKAWDTLNDPMMGNIIDSTKSRFGKFKPWVFIGMLGSAGILLALFCNNLQGWDFVILFAFMYFLWTIFFTMNDIGYWGMIPSLATNPNDRNKLTSLTALCASFGGGICGVVIPMFTTGTLAINGNAIDAYRILTIIFVAVFIVFQMITVIGVDNKQMAVSIPQEKFKFSHIFSVLKNNKQVLWASLAFFFTQLMPNAAITMFVYFQYGYNGTLTTLVAVFNGLFTVLVYMFFSKFSKKYSRRQIFTFSYICGMVGYGLMILFALVIPNVVAFHVPFFELDITYQFMLEAVAYGLVGLSGCTSYLICSISITNCVEYNEYLSGKRDEGIVYSMRTFIVSLGVTFINLIVMLFYIIIGIEKYTDQISALEQAANLGTIDTSLGTKDEQIANVINNTPHLQVILLITFIGGFAMLMLTAAYIVYMKKYKITESRYDKIMAILEARHNNVEEPEVLEDLEKAPK